MINEHKGNLLKVSAGIIVHGCNTLGVMGAGVALHIKKEFPEVFTAYRRVYEARGLVLGQTISVPVVRPGAGQRIFINAMTQDRLAQRPGELVVSYDAISQAFAKVRELAESTGLSVHFPLIGCGLAGGDWSEVSVRIEEALGPQVEKHLWCI